MQKYEVIVRLLLAVAVGGVIGYERSFKNRPAGFRTHILVCVGAAIISIIQIETIEQTKAMIMDEPLLAQALKADIGRMGAQVITGVGFLGAGTIIREKGLVKGLTTAASVWAVSCIGLAIGLGMYFITIFATITVFVALVILKKVENRFIEKSNKIELEIEYDNNKNFIEEIQNYFQQNQIKVRNIRFMTKNDMEEIEYEKTLYTLQIPRHKENTKVMKELCQYKSVVTAKII